jgi:hypothetical protein
MVPMGRRARINEIRYLGKVAAEQRGREVDEAGVVGYCDIK